MKSKGKLIALLVAGVVMALGPVWGMLGTILGVVMAFGHMGQDGMGDPELLANDIGVAMYTTAAGLIMCPVGVTCILIAVIYLNRRKKFHQNTP